MRKHAFDYLILFTAGVFFLIALQMFRGERLMQFISLTAFSAFYIVWGLYHHLTRDKLHLKIIIEYILIGSLALFALKIIIFPF